MRGRRPGAAPGGAQLRPSARRAACRKTISAGAAHPRDREDFMTGWKRLIVPCLIVAASTASARAEVGEVTIAQQFGVSFLPLMLMERDGLIEKRARAGGIDTLKTNWLKVAGPSVMNDGLISGTIHFASTGAPSLATLWSKTRGSVGVKGVAALTSYPLYFVTRNPDLKSLKDLGSKDKIAVPSV